MPVKSEKQRRFFEMIASGKKKSGAIGPSKEVAQKFLSHKGKK